MRENVDELLAKHRSSIEGLRHRTRDVLPSETMYDDIWLLRFVLTHSKKGTFAEAEAEDAVRKTIQFRTDNSKLLHDAAANGSHPMMELMQKFMLFGRIGTINGNEPIFGIRLGHLHPKALLQAMPVDDIVLGLLCNREILCRHCDQRTRDTRMMIRSIAVWDLESVGFKNYDGRMLAAVRRAAELSAIYFPQTLARTVMINMPSYATAFFRTIIATFSPSVRDKFTFCPRGAGKTAAQCPFLSGLGGTDDTVPRFLGGTMPCPAALLERADDKDSLTRLAVSARSTKEVDIFAPTQGSVLWELLVEEYGVEMSAVFIRDLNPADPLTEDVEHPYEPQLGEPTEVLPAVKVKSEDGLKQGTIALPGKGVVRVTFDNSYSVLRSKTLQYRLVIQPLSQTMAGE